MQQLWQIAFFFEQKWNFWVFNFKKSGNLQDSDSVRWSSSLAPSGNTNNLLTRFNKSVLFAIIHTILDPFINIFGPIFSTLIWNNGKNILTDFFYKCGTMPTPTKSWNPTVLGQGGLDITQWSHPSKYRHCRPSFCHNGYPPLKRTKQNKVFFTISEFDFLPT